MDRRIKSGDDDFFFVMPGLVPGIHAFAAEPTW